jgi:hypothetical protein
MSTGKTDASVIGAADKLEAEIRAAARPILEGEELAQAARDQAVREAKWAAAKARTAAEAQTAKAAEYEAQAAALAKGD